MRVQKALESQLNIAKNIMTEYEAQVAEVNSKFVQRLEEINRQQAKVQCQAPSFVTAERARKRREEREARNLRHLANNNRSEYQY